ncbi:MAG: glycosyltransferase family 4 protein [Candidatus Omnitrophica bacterium]|nr:glycosyltransferase family 4 protein [Candidatus Omnitrophota bacterium]
MRILLLTTHLDVGGISNYVVSLAKALTRRNHSVIVMSAGGSMVADLQKAGILHLPLSLRVKSEMHPWMLKAIAQILKAVGGQRPDVIHAHTRVTHWAAGVSGRLAKIPVVTTCHGFYRWRWHRQAFPFWGKRVMAVSRTVHRRLTMRFHVPRRKAVCISNGIDWEEKKAKNFDAQVEFYRQAWGISSQKPVVGSIARLVQAKGHVILIRAFHELRQHIPEAQMVLVGDGPLREELIRLIYELGEQEHVILTGSVAHTAIPLSTFTVFVQPSLQEAFGLSLVEAMAMRLPLVVAAVGGMREIVQEGETGYKVSPRNPLALANAIRKILENPQQAKAMGEAGYRRYRRLFTMDRVASEVEAVYAQVAGEKRS